ncbi:Hypothetical_protein [Hexamita inflata]|uniref:Hypothetical_protein n=1 Tax=Hexamita inflata TaxID=28002 RepID=A0AA86UXZ9_9EUKA|nr:Hypothetical protein HINF_LOCUS7587 [Hexamita inflata]CAI9946565.1 Hypothetical protein HINF_LOCUS34210 [Hexamita inflata]CAI9947523.1 Hypothetical protein HINF_LOCUS35168 [Hexamita inflata]CAI9947664.1 Hypothetical protein HINF_LOCUS35309 [Hexamita inflata]CAI9952453.1 Hypothetical protein HINF_LOCUS40098 [Hexamita inflata]
MLPIIESKRLFTQQKARFSLYSDLFQQGDVKFKQSPKYQKSVSLSVLEKYIPKQTNDIKQEVIQSVQQPVKMQQIKQLKHRLQESKKEILQLQLKEQKCYLQEKANDKQMRKLYQWVSTIYARYM